MKVEFGREITGTLETSQTREWLVTNGLGGYASGTVAGMLTRRYHGLLVAALKPPLGRTLLLAKLDETATYDGLDYPLFTNCWAGNVVDPHGYLHIESFRLEGAIPIWRFACADALLEKRIWMEQGAIGAAPTTYVAYHLRRASGPVTLSLKALANYRDYHSMTQAGDWQMGVETVANGLKITAHEAAVPFYLLSDTAEPIPHHDWYHGFDLPMEDYRGFDHQEDHLFVGAFRATLEPGQWLTLVASTRADPDLDGQATLGRRRTYEQELLARAKINDEATPTWMQQLVLAADQFIVSRPLPDNSEGKSIIAGYPWFGDWGRDTMISLPGLTLNTGRPEVARNILHTFARYVDQGMLPNRFPDSGEKPEYNTADATLWYFEAIRAYYEATGDLQLIGELFSVLAEIVDWHRRGTHYHIQVDPDDGLLYAGESGVQLTWMDARVNGWVVTPRIGKPVEINALWYNALTTMIDFAKLLDEPFQKYEAAANLAFKGFGRFWNERAGYCYDVIDGPNGPDASLRPNQIFAVSLPASPLSLEQQCGVVDVCGRRLLTSCGLRSLAPADPHYHGHYGGDRFQRDGAYHQGTVWGWLLGPFCLAHFRVYNDPEQALGFLEPMADHLSAAGLGSLSEIFDGDLPLTPRGCIAQAWTVAEVIRAWQEISAAHSGETRTVVSLKGSK
jgi:predicted glycogen debranching enzyme